MIYLIRHGQTDMNKKGVLLGRTDVPLNEEGRREAEDVGSYFRSHNISFHACYSSPLQRALETAEIVTGFQNEKIVKNDLLLEMNYGPYEGVSLKNPPDEIKVFFRDFVHNPAPKGMEPLSHVTARLGRFLDGLSCRPEDNILISTHAIAMKGALEYLTPTSHGSYWSRYIGNCAVYRFDRKDGNYTVPEEVMFTK